MSRDTECGGGKNGGAKIPLIQEKGDAGEKCKGAQKIAQRPPFIVQGEIRSANDVDCYSFKGKKSQTYLIGVTGSMRKIVATGPANGTGNSTDGLLIFTPNKDGDVCICVSGGKKGAYLLTVTPG